MAKIYETIEDAHRDDLKQKVTSAKQEMDATFIGATWAGVATTLALQLDNATGFKSVESSIFDLGLKKPGFLKKFEQTKFAQWLDGVEKNHEFKILAGLAATYAVMETVFYFVSRSEKKKAEAELKQIGPGKEIIKLPDGSSIELPRDTDAMKHFLEDAPAIQQAATKIHTGKDTQVERLQESVQQVAV